MTKRSFKHVKKLVAADNAAAKLCILMAEAIDELGSEERLEQTSVYIKRLEAMQREFRRAIQDINNLVSGRVSQGTLFCLGKDSNDPIDDDDEQDYTEEEWEEEEPKPSFVRS